MNIRKIIKEEVNDFEWAEETTPFIRMVNMKGYLIKQTKPVWLGGRTTTSEIYQVDVFNKGITFSYVDDGTNTGIDSDYFTELILDGSMTILTPNGDELKPNQILGQDNNPIEYEH